MLHWFTIRSTKLKPTYDKSKALLYPVQKTQSIACGVQMPQQTMFHIWFSTNTLANMHVQRRIRMKLFVGEIEQSRQLWNDNQLYMTRMAHASQGGI